MNTRKKTARFIVAVFAVTIVYSFSVFGNTGETDTVLSEWLARAVKSGEETSGEVICDQEGEACLRLVSAASSLEEGCEKEIFVIAKNFYAEGTCLKQWFGDDVIYSNDIEGEYVEGEELYRLQKFLLRKKKESPAREKVTEQIPSVSEDSGKSFHLGDRVARNLDGREYSFTCIDENYSDIYGNHTGQALFIMDDVIPAGYKGEYRTGQDENGILFYEWCPGPVSFFGNSNDFKTSEIRKFLNAQEQVSGSDVQIGTPFSYTGSTETGRFSQTDERGLSSYPEGYQHMTSRLFILSLEEAMKYREFLWKFGSESENPEKVTESTCTSYWLRTRYGSKDECGESGLCYVVDLISGNIHPEKVRPDSESGDPFIDTQTATGTRPVFVLPNNK